jgi:3-deoxy-manno-octulosonate cytidylyltransferase (CMP-KDO synthetase)
VAAAVEGFGGDWELTPAECASGTDRIAHAARGWGDADVVVNVQGDWLIDPPAIGRLAAHLATHPEDELATLAVPAGPDAMERPAVVKVVCDPQGYALYFSRAPIPYPRQAGGARPLEHWGIYGYRRQTLLALAATPPTPLERTESLEQLRALETGVRIRVLVVAGRAVGMDTPEDVARVEAVLGEEGGGWEGSGNEEREESATWRPSTSS